MPVPPRLARWRDQRPSRVLVLVAILVAFVVLTVWNLARGGDFDFYASAARSMSESWRALAFGAFDPAATVTLDKLAGFVVPQAASVAIFGMSTSALALPQVVEGVVTVWVVSLVALRHAGPRVGLLAAGAAASTPIFVSMFGHPMEDGLLTASLAVALLWWQRAVLTGRSWPMLVAGIAVGVGFQAKMLQAWLILPALVIAALLAGGPLGRRVRSTVVLAVSAVVASLSWTIAMALVPAGSRPYADGSTDDSVLAMVFGYNGLDRFVPGAVPGAVGSLHRFGGGGAGSGFAGHGFGEHGFAEHGFAGHGEHHLHAVLTGATSFQHTAGGAEGALKLLVLQYATQVGWLYPAALVGAVLALRRWWPWRRGAGLGARARGAMAVALVVWFVTAVAVLSAIRLPHTAYVAAIGVQLALLAAIAWSELVRGAVRGRGPARLGLLLLLVAQAVWAVVLGSGGRTPQVLAVPAAVLLGAGLVAAIALGLRRRRGGHAGGRRLVGACLALTAVALVAGQVAWSLQALDDARDGSGGDASVGLRVGRAGPAEATGVDAFHVSPPKIWGGHFELSHQAAEVVRLAERAGGGRAGDPLLLTDRWALSASIIIPTGRSVLTDGGYSGTVPVFDVAAVRQLVSSGEVRVLAVQDRARYSDPVAKVARSSLCRPLATVAAPSGYAGFDRQAAYDLFTCG